MITLGDSLKNIFQDAISCQEPSGLVMEFNVYRTDPRFRYFAFVEAADDAKFYSNSNESWCGKACIYAIFLRYKSGFFVFK